MADKQDSVKDYYGKRLATSADLQMTGVVQCTRKAPKLPSFIKDALGLVHNDITSREYGCATAYPEVLDSMNVLDLGSGCGRDCFVLSNVVGEKGRVVGLDMTDELLEISRSKIDYHTKTYGYDEPNVDFVKGVMERMGDAGLKDNYFDIIVSNCVISLCRDKRAVLSEAYKVLKDGGEMFFSDMYRDGDLPADVMDDQVLWCEGLIGSLTYRDLHKITKDLGFTAPRLVKADTIPVVDESVKKRLGDVKYASATYRLFKKTKDAGSTNTAAEVTYKGGIRGYEEKLEFDHALCFQKDTPVPVDAEVQQILKMSRFATYFSIKSIETFVQDKVDVDPFKLIEETKDKTPCCG